MSFSSSYGGFPFAGVGISSDPRKVTAARAAEINIAGDGDYTLKANGCLTDAPDPVDEEVAYLLGTIEGTVPGEPTKGNGVSRVRTYTDQAAVLIRDAIRRALQPSVDRGVIRDVVVTSAPYNQHSTAVADYLVTYKKTNRVVRR